MAEAPGRTEITDSQRSFQNKRPAHQLTPDSYQAPVRQRAFIGLGNPVKYIFFAVRRINRLIGFGLQRSYLYDNARTLVEQLDKLIVNFVNLLSQFFKRNKSNPKSQKSRKQIIDAFRLFL